MRKKANRLLGIVLATALAVTGVSYAPTANAQVGATTEKITSPDKTTTMSSNGYTFDHSYVKPGDTLKVLKDGTEVTDNVSWTVEKVASANKNDVVTYTRVAEVSSPSLTITDDYLETMIYGEIDGQKLTIYCSKTPVIYMNSDTNYYDVIKSDYNDATMNLVGSQEYADSKYWYQGDCKIKLRGNSTAFREKRPFKLKLDKKADLLNLGDENGTSVKSKHWVLLANDIDHSFMRNKLLYDFSGDIGTETYFKSTNVTLIYNGQYEGVYQLCEHRRVDEGRIDITNWEKYGSKFAEAIATKQAETYATSIGETVDSAVV